MQFRALAPQFRNIIFNNLSYGGNTIPEKLEKKIETSEDFEKLMTDWINPALEKLDELLPKKFYLAGHCGGCALAANWAMKNTHRLKKLFCSDPGGLIHPPASFDPMNQRMDDESIAPNSKQLIKTFYPKRGK